MTPTNMENRSGRRYKEKSDHPLCPFAGTCNVLPRWNDWENLSQLLRSFAARHFGKEAVSVTINFVDSSTTLLLPKGFNDQLRDPPAEQPPPVVVQSAPATPATVGEPMHTSDFQRIDWPGLGTFHLSPKKAAVVRKLWPVALTDDPWVSQTELLRAADSDATRLVDLFKGDPAWGRLILSNGRGYYRLAPLPDPPSQQD